MTVLLLDAYNLLFRSFTSLPPAITADDGTPINAVYGMLAFVLRLLRDFEPTHVVAAFDSPQTPTFRHLLYPDYQGHRGPMGGDQAAEFERQVETARRILPQIGVPALALPGFEADDVMGTLACRVAERGGTAIMVSTDGDLLQLIGNGVEVLVPGKANRHIRDVEGVMERFGVPPAGVTTYKALAGDPSDNIPGLPGIGAKTAARLVHEHGDLEAILAHLDVLPERFARTLESGQDTARLFRQVATIKSDLDLPIDLEALPRPDLVAQDRPRSILDRLGYGSQAEEEGQQGP